MVLFYLFAKISIQIVWVPKYLKELDKNIRYLFKASHNVKKKQKFCCGFPNILTNLQAIWRTINYPKVMIQNSTKNCKTFSIKKCFYKKLKAPCLLKYLKFLVNTNISMHFGKTHIFHILLCCFVVMYKIVYN